jgi:hypothetical protein
MSLWLQNNPRVPPRRVVTCSRQSLSCPLNGRSARCLFHRSNECCVKLPGIQFLRNLWEWVQVCISRFSCAKHFDSISASEPVPWHRKRAGHKAFPLYQIWAEEWMHRWTWWTFQHLIKHCSCFLLLMWCIVWQKIGHLSGMDCHSIDCLYIGKFIFRVTYHNCIKW